jgi:ABC-2 type transport system ATP-binding protein
MSQNVIEIAHLSKYYGTKCALNDLTLNIPDNAISAIVGANGAGKSTLFQILLGILKPSAGQASVLGCDSRSLTSAIRGLVGFVNEEHSLPDWLSIGQLAKMQQKAYPQWQEDVYQHIIGNFNVSPSQIIGSLSRGERAGVNLSMAMAQQPKLLLLDEPTLGLDVVAKRAFLESLMFSQENCDSAIVYCSHALDEIERLAEHLIIIERGKLRNHSTLEDFVSRVQCWKVQFNGKTPNNNVIPGLLQSSKVDNFHLYTVLDQTDDYASVLQSLGAEKIHSVPVNLVSAVSDFLSKNHAAHH